MLWVVCQVRATTIATYVGRSAHALAVDARLWVERIRRQATGVTVTTKVRIRIKVATLDERNVAT